MSETKHNFHDIFFATERYKEFYKDIVYGEIDKQIHNHVGLKEDGTTIFHEVRDENVELTWTSNSITNIGFRLNLR